jgi:hypothetical protein
MPHDTVVVEVGFGTDPLEPVAGSYSWTDITDHVTSVHTKFGRDAELARTQPGTLELVIDDPDREFDPLNTAGPYYGDLVPNVPVRVYATDGGTDRPMFYGFVDGWPQTYANDWSTLITVTATDAFKLLARNRLPKDLYAREVLADNPKAYWRFEEPDGQIELTDHSGNGWHGTYPIGRQNYEYNSVGLVDDSRQHQRTSGWNTDTTFGSAFAFGKVVTPTGSGPSGTAYTIEFWLQWPPVDGTAGGSLVPYRSGAAGLFGAGGTIVQLACTGSDPGKLNFQGRETADRIDDDLVHHIACVRNGGTVAIYVDGVDVATGTASTTTVDGEGGAIFGSFTILPADCFEVAAVDELAIYDTALSSARILDHYQIGSAAWAQDLSGARVERLLDETGWPTLFGRDIDTGNVTLGKITDRDLDLLTVAQRIEATEQGAFYVDHRQLDSGVAPVRWRERRALYTDTRSTTSQFTFTDDPAAGPSALRYSNPTVVYDETDIVNRVEVTWEGGLEVVEDAASVGRYGPLTVTVDTDLTTQVEARNLGEHLVSVYAAPTVRVKDLTFECSADTRLYDPATLLRIDDRITFRRQPKNTGQVIERELFVRGIEHTIDRGSHWVTKVYTSEADATAYWIWGTSEWDDTTRWAW